VRAAPGGAVFGTWSSGGWPNGFRTLSVHGKALVSPYEHITCGYLAPGPDGRTVFTGSSGRLDLDGNPLDAPGAPRPVTPIATIPCSDPAYFLSVSGLNQFVTGYEDPAYPTRPPPPSPITASVHAADGSPLLTVHGFDEMTFKGVDRVIWGKTDLTIDKRFHLVPAAQLLITIPPENDRLVLRRLDLDQAMNRSGADYLLVVSKPTVAATAGRKLEHQVVARSKKGGVKFSLSDGPEGMSVASDGKLTWMVPEKLKGEDAVAVVRADGAAGLQRLHRLRIRID
jgi:hypothetical protein